MKNLINILKTIQNILILLDKKATKKFKREIDDYLNNATYNSSIIKTGDFYVTSTYNLDNMKVRKRDSPKIDRIPPIEIEKSIEYVLKLQYASSRDDLMKQSSTHLGFTKLTTKVKSYFEEMINKMLLENKLSDDNGNISLKMD